MSRPPLRLVVVAGALGLGLAAGSAGDPAPAAVPGQPQDVTVVGAEVVCPDLRQQPELVRSTVAAGVALARPEPDEPPVLLARRLGGDPAPDPAAPSTEVEVAPPAGAVVGLGTDGTDTALEVRAVGEGAAGLSVVQTGTTTAEAVRGLAATPCGPAGTDGWLLGGSTTVGEASFLLLVNPDDAPAVVDVTVLTAEGPVDERTGRGISVPARGRSVVPLDTVAPDRSRLAVRVQASRGRVVAAVRHERSDGLIPKGIAYAAAVQAPAETVVVPAVPSGPGGRSVWVANPGETDVEVAVEVTTADGQFVPDGLDNVLVPSRSTESLDLSAVLGATPAALRVTATGGPVLAAGVAEDAGEDDVRDLVYLAPAPALAGPVLVPEAAVDETTRTVLLLSAVSGDAVVDVLIGPVVEPAAGAEALSAPSRRVDVPGGRTVALTVSDLLPEGTRGRAALEVRPDRRGSPVHAGVAVVGRPLQGPLLTGWSLRVDPARVPQPAVVRDPAVGAGSG
jgi:hypothetical protein